MVPGIDAKEPLCVVDALPGFRPQADRAGRALPPTCAYLPESERGIEVRRHPRALLDASPRLWGTWARFTSLDVRDLGFEERRRFSALELDLWREAAAAEERKRAATVQATGAEAPAAAGFGTLRTIGRGAG